MSPIVIIRVFFISSNFPYNNFINIPFQEQNIVVTNTINRFCMANASNGYHYSVSRTIGQIETDDNRVIFWNHILCDCLIQSLYQFLDRGITDFYCVIMTFHIFDSSHLTTRCY